jgi:hypothetical protein
MLWELVHGNWLPSAVALGFVLNKVNRYDFIWENLRQKPEGIAARDYFASEYLRHIMLEDDVFKNDAEMDTRKSKLKEMIGAAIQAH